MRDGLRKLDDFIKRNTEKTVNSYSREYKESKWYKEPSLRDVFGDYIAKDIQELKKALESGDGLLELVKRLEDTAASYGRSWYDEDLEKIRTGYEWECETYTFLRNIAAEEIGKEPIDYHTLYEGYGEE